MLPRQVISRFQPLLEKIRDQVHWREASKFGKKNTASDKQGLGFCKSSGSHVLLAVGEVDMVQSREGHAEVLEMGTLAENCG